MMCDRCCKSRDRECVRHGNRCSYIGCNSQYNKRCDDDACKNCCSISWCAAHGDPNLCRFCETKKKASACPDKRCKDCCSSLNCLPHFGCGRCRKRLLDVGCAGKSCRSCCKIPCKVHGCRHCRKPLRRKMDDDCGSCPTCCRKKSNLACESHNKKWFGTFKCSCGNQWSSAYAYTGWTQECRRCSKSTFSLTVRAHEGGGGDLSKPHDEDRCEKCKSGRKCARKIPNLLL